ncbi:ADYC domain-containing protein [Corallococcus terminator]|nr:ADYC domain-containing protein [Corallococcus terminator]
MKAWRQGLLGAVMLGSAVVVAEPPPTNSAQGTQLHGSERFESINIPHASVEGPPLPSGVTCATVKSGMVGGRIVVWQVTCTGGTPPFPGALQDGPSLVGTTFRAPFEGRSVKLVIQEARCHVGITGAPVACSTENLNSGAARWEFRVSATTDDKTTVPLCPTGSGFALAVPHPWSAGGELLNNPDYFTFACAPSNQGTSSSPFFVGGGVIAKCIDWGYAPWSGATNGDDITRDSHELCTRMARADYCGEGKSNTLDGTPLSFMGPQNALALSTNGYPAATVNQGQYALEAVWARDSCGTVRPLCLGKKRWDSLSLEATCLNRALEAGTPPVIATGPSIRPCEDMKLTNFADDTLLVSYSLFIDRALVMFKKNDTEFVTTTSVVADLQEHPGFMDVSTFKTDLTGDGLADMPSPYVPLRAEGPILSAKLPANIKKRMGAFIKPLYRCVDSAGRKLLTDSNTCAPATGFFLHAMNSDQGIEGYVYSSVDTVGTGQRRPLKLWKHPTLGFYATSTQSPSSAFVFIKDLGYLPAVGQLPGRDL